MIMVNGLEVADYIVRLLNIHHIEAVSVPPELLATELMMNSGEYTGVIFTNNGIDQNMITKYLKQLHRSSVWGIVASGHITEQMKSEWISFGVRAVLPLPFSVEEILNAIGD